MAGLVMFAGAGIDICLNVKPAEPADALPVARAIASHGTASSSAVAPIVLKESDLPALQRALAARAADAGLGWPSANYRLLPANEALPPAYEVHCALKGGYPSIRRFIVGTLKGSPPASLREFALTRATPDNAEVEAHLTFAFFLAPAENGAIAASVAPAAASEARP